MGLFLLIDMDYFFAACEELRHQEYKNKALVVGTSSSENKEKGVVQTCNYIARKYGIHSAMSMSEALKLNPNLTYVASDEAYYEQISRKLEQLIRSRELRMEVMSIDEIAIETSDDDYSKALALAESIKDEINNTLGLPCTIGVSCAIVYAKMVCDAYKPNKIGVVRREDLVDFIKDKDVGAIIGVGDKTKKRLDEMGIKTIGQLAKSNPANLIAKFGKFGGELALISRGDMIDIIHPDQQKISISRERSVDQSLGIDGIEMVMKHLADEIIAEVKEKNMSFGSVSSKVRYIDFSYSMRTKKLSVQTDSAQILYRYSIALLKVLMKSNKVRKVGIRVSELKENSNQMRL